MNIKIRACVLGDETALSLLGQATFLETFAGVLGGADIVTHCAAQHAAAVYRLWLEHGQTHLWMAEIEPGGAPVGYLVLAAAALPVADLSEGDLEIKRIYLLHRFQGHGLGKRLLDEAIKFSVQRGAQRLLLGVYAKNEQAIGFYRRYGFAPVGARRFRVGDNDYDDSILARVIISNT